jgi:hypothetical protein
MKSAPNETFSLFVGLFTPIGCALPPSVTTHYEPQNQTLVNMPTNKNMKKMSKQFFIPHKVPKPNIENNTPHPFSVKKFLQKIHAQF